MTKEELIKYVSNPDVTDECERYYCDNAPNRHIQEGDWDGPPIEGVACVRMCLNLLLDWMSEEANDSWHELSMEDKKEVFNKSYFSECGVLGFDKEDADYYFNKHYKDKKIV
jgi:hypothetical protein